MITTERLLLREWRDADREPFARMNADPLVMRYFARCLSTAESDTGVEWIRQHFATHGFGLFAAELIEDRSFIGFIGISIPAFEAHFTPCVEIGWRLAADYWGRGLATEGARAVVKHAFDDLKLPELVSFTTETNIPSRRVMEKIGMRRDPSEDFDHPSLPPDHPLKRHVLYRIRRA